MEEGSAGRAEEQEERDRQVAEEEARKRALDEHVRSYRETLRQDDTVTSIKILDMTRPVEVANVYVQLKLRQDAQTHATGTLAARIAGYRQRSPLAAFTELEVLEFRPEDIHEFVNRWFGTQDAQRVQKGKDLNAQLKDNIRIQTLAANPLLPSLIVLLYERLYEQHERLPERRAELYKRCVDMLLFEWDKRNKSIQRFSGLRVDE